MANIELNGLFLQKQREFNLQGAGLQRFESDFIDSTNRAINRINREADLASSISRISTTEDTVSLDERYEDVLSTLISLNLLKMGQRPAKGGELELPSLEAKASDAIAQLYFDLINIEQDADTDDETYDIVGLGHLG